MLARLFVLVVIGWMMTLGVRAPWHDVEAPAAVAELDTVAEEIEEEVLGGHVVCSGPVPDVALDQPRAERAVPSIDGARVFRPPRVFGS